MAAAVVSDVYLLDLQQCDEREGEPFLAQVSDFVSTHRHKSLTLKNPAGATWRIGGLEDTIYRDEHEEVNAWGKFYLPEMVNMRVVGVVEGSSCPCEQLVLMTCENKKLYAYDGEELHLVASSWKQLNNKEIEYPASKSYYNGEAFQDMTEDDWADIFGAHIDAECVLREGKPCCESLRFIILNIILIKKKSPGTLLSVA
ncbi:uncharacterized protein LOC128374088 isoform X2 [Scomber scombrus]|uniref:Uncharacterized protein LOC128374088 isoform X2 n=1 Tax=Scomber scombrus TaxID=13677 RepID=A0AAV1NN13_SCOSC